MKLKAILMSLLLVLGLTACAAGPQGEQGPQGEPGVAGEDARVEPFTVTFDSMGGSAVAPIEMDHIGRITKPADPTKDFHAFDGWYTEDGYEWIFSKDIVAEDTTLYAHWEIDPTTTYTFSAAKVDENCGADELAVITSGNVHDGDGWKYAWRSYFVFEADGTLAYAVLNPSNGYGGPTEYTYMSVYTDYTQNPAIELLEGFRPWVPGGTAHNQFLVKVPTGGFAVVGHGAPVQSLITAVLGYNVYDYGDATVNKTTNKVHGKATLDGTTITVDTIAIGYSGTTTGAVTTVNEEAGTLSVELEMNIWNRYQFTVNGVTLTSDKYDGAVQSGAGDGTKLYYESNAGVLLQNKNGTATWRFTYTIATGRILVELL